MSITLVVVLGSGICVGVSLGISSVMDGRNGLENWSSVHNGSDLVVIL